MSAFQRMVGVVQKTFWPESNSEDRVTGWQSIDEMINSQWNLAEFNSEPRREALGQKASDAEENCETVKKSVGLASGWQRFNKKLDWLSIAIFEGLFGIFPKPIVLVGAAVPPIEEDDDEKSSSKEDAATASPAKNDDETQSFEGRDDISLFEAPFIYKEAYQKVPFGNGILRFIVWSLFYFIPVSLVNVGVLFVHGAFNFTELGLRGLGHVFRLLSDTCITRAFKKDNLEHHPVISILWISGALASSPLWIVGKIFQLAADFVDQLHHLFSVGVVFYWGIMQWVSALCGIIINVGHEDSLNYRKILNPLSWGLILVKTIGISIVLAAAPLLAVFIFLPLLSLTAAILVTLATAIVLFMAYSIVKAIKRAYESEKLGEPSIVPASRTGAAHASRANPDDLSAKHSLSTKGNPAPEKEPRLSEGPIRIGGVLLDLAPTSRPGIYYLTVGGQPYRTNPNDPLTTLYMMREGSPYQGVGDMTMVNLGGARGAGEYLFDDMVLYRYCTHARGAALIPPPADPRLAVAPQSAPMVLSEKPMESQQGRTLVEWKQTFPDGDKSTVPVFVLRDEKGNDHRVKLDGNDLTPTLYLIPQKALNSGGEISSHLRLCPIRHPGSSGGEVAVSGEKINGEMYLYCVVKASVECGSQAGSRARATSATARTQDRKSGDGRSAHDSKLLSTTNRFSASRSDSKSPMPAHRTNVVTALSRAALSNSPVSPFKVEASSGSGREGKENKASLIMDKGAGRTAALATLLEAQNPDSSPAEIVYKSLDSTHEENRVIYKDSKGVLKHTGLYCVKADYSDAQARDLGVALIKVEGQDGELVNGQAYRYCVLSTVFRSAAPDTTWRWVNSNRPAQPSVGESFLPLLRTVSSEISPRGAALPPDNDSDGDTAERRRHGVMDPYPGSDYRGPLL